MVAGITPAYIIQVLYTLFWSSKWPGTTESIPYRMRQQCGQKKVLPERLLIRQHKPIICERFHTILTVCTKYEVTNACDII